MKREPRWRRYVNRLIANEVSRAARFYDRLVQWRPREHDSGLLREHIRCEDKSVATELDELSTDSDSYDVVLLNGNLNHDHDIQATLTELKPRLKRSTRVALVLYNPYSRWLYRVTAWLRMRKGPVPDTFITKTDLLSVLKLSGYELVRIRPCVYIPTSFFGLGSLVNWLMPAIPGMRWLSLVGVYWVRPRMSSEKPSLSVIIPARNEKGNIAAALERLPDFGGADLEIVFVEGNSTDETWAEINRVVDEYQGPWTLAKYQQPGKGKGDAVRLGFAKATKDLVTILDADLTMPPELLPRFYDAYCRGLADFVNGSRLVYPMEGEAMRPLNRLGNIFFAKALSEVLQTRLGDSLCGTKLLSRGDYMRMTRWREVFGDFDPFGDFELLFPAAELALGMVDVPIRYLDRTYGSTNIFRFRHGAQLLKMTIIGLFKVTCGAGS